MVLVWVLAAAPSSARSASVETYAAETGPDVVLLSGEIAAGDADSLMKIVEAAVLAGRPAPSLSLNSQGGLFLEGIRLAETVRRFGLVTYVEEGAQCASACFLVFVAGKGKFASYSARIGVHSAKEVTGDALRAAAGTETMGVLLRAFGRRQGSREHLQAERQPAPSRGRDGGERPDAGDPWRGSLAAEGFDPVGWEEFRISLSETTLSRELRALGYRKLSARPRHYAQNPEALEAFKKTSRPNWRRSGRASRTAPP